MDEETLKSLEEEVGKKVENDQNTDDIKEEMQSGIEEGHKKLMNEVTLQLQKEKDDKIIEVHQNILEEVELQLEDVHVKYKGIFSNARVIKDQA